MRRRMLMGSKTNIDTLPSGYTKLNYLQSTGTEYIDTGIAIYKLENPSVEIEMKTYSYDSFAYNGLYTTGAYFQMGISADYKGSMRINGRGSVLTPAVVDINDFHTLYMKSGLQMFDGVVIGEDISDAKTKDSNFIMFGRKSGGIAQPKPMAIKRLQIKDGDTLIMKLIPAQNSEGVLGMYDIVTNTFLTNNGTGEFIGG